MKSKKGIVCGDALNNNLTDELTMNNLPKFQFKSNTDGDCTRRELLEQTKLSRLPKLPTHPKLELPKFEPPTKAAVCVNCGGWLDPDDSIQQSVKVCRKCLTQYAVIDAAIDEASNRKRRGMLAKFAEVK